MRGLSGGHGESIRGNPRRLALRAAAVVLVIGGAVMGTVASASSPGTNRLYVYPGMPLVQISPFAVGVTGNIASNTKGVQVALTLHRAGKLIATAPTATTNAAGAWATSFTPHAPTDLADEVDVSYSGAGAPTGANHNYQSYDYANFDNAAVIGPGGEDITISCAVRSCGNVIVVTVRYGNGAVVVSQARRDGHGGYETKLRPAVTANDLVTFQPEYQDGATYVAPVATASLPGVGRLFRFGDGNATCTADLVAKQVSCSPVYDAGTYEIAESRGGSAVATANPAPVDNGFNDGSGTVTATFSALKSGDQVALIAPAAGGEPARTISALHVYPLTATVSEGDIHLDQPQTTGTCEPDEFSQGGFYFGGAGLCSDSGTFSEPGIADHQPAFEDELSGGATTLNIPQINDTSPIDDELVPTSFVAYADVVKQLSPFNPFQPGLPSEAFDTTDPVSLTLSPLGSALHATFPGNANSAAGVSVSRLAAGRYVASWRITDANGDTDTLKTWFVAEASESGASGSTGPQGSQGSQGSQGPQGPQGKQGPAGSSVEVVCTVTHKHKHKRRTCTVKRLRVGSKVSLSLRRGRIVFALGHARAGRHGATVALHQLRAIRPGRYELTLVVASGRNATTITRAIRLR